MTEKRLIKRLKARNEQAFNSYYAQHAPQLKYLIYRYVGNEVIAEDLLHEGFMTMLEKIGQYKGVGNFEGWIRRIFINTALMYLRKNKKMTFHADEINEEILSDIDDKPNIDTDIINLDKINMEVINAAEFSDEELEEAINKLPEHYRVVFNLFVIDGYSHKEIALMLNLNEKTSKSRLSKARKKAADYLYKQAIEKVKMVQL